MKVTHTPDSLRSFTARVADAFNAGRIHAPVHLSGGNELNLIEYFRTYVGENDYVCTYWRSHYHCLLRGVPEDRLFDDILAGRSITLCYPEFRIFSSAIVGGWVPVALGLALQTKRSVSKLHVHCFVGDMTARTGILHECERYAKGHELPITFIEEDNGKSVCTPTREAWGTGSRGHEVKFGKINYHRYELPWPHSGAGKRVNF